MLEEAKQKSTHPSHVMVWLELKFDSISMTVTLLPEKPEVMALHGGQLAPQIISQHP